MKKITDDLIYIGVDDRDIDLFEGQYVVPEGVTYNSYILIDKKIAVFDTADKRRTEEWLNNLQLALNGKNPDYLIISHMEPDHSASIEAFFKKYPEAVAVGNDKTFVIAERFFPNLIKNKLSVKEGETLSLGRHTLKFVFAPMVHWPEVMFAYDEYDKALFSADAFGKFGTADGGDWACEARRYYFNIVGKYGNVVQNVLKKTATLDIKIICPLHGPVLTENLGYYIDKYNVWSAYLAEDKGVTIAYSSIYGNTKAAAERLAGLLKAKGEKVSIFDLARCDTAEAIEDAFRYDRLVVASVTLDAGLAPATDDFLMHLKSKNYRNRKVGFIENGSWAPYAAKAMKAYFEGMKNITIIEPAVTVTSALNAHSETALKALAEELLK